MRKLLLYDLDMPEHLDLFEYADLRTIDSINMSNDFNSGSRMWAAAVSTNDYAILKLTRQNAIKIAAMLNDVCRSSLFVALWDCQEDQEVSKFLREYFVCYVSKNLNEIKEKFKAISSRNADVDCRY